MTVRVRVFILAMVCLCLSGLVVAQSNDDEGPMTRVPVDKSAPAPKDNRKAPPRSDQLAPDESSSKQTQIDVSPPSGDKKQDSIADNSDVSEFHPWDPHKAAKCVEVGDYYFKQENYRAAVSRYQEALEWKPKDAEATYKLGEAQEKSGDLTAALGSYQAYLKILPKGPYADKAQKGIDRLKSKAGATSAQAAPKPS
jgi:tetratricopeptide (TPR) repeat protein